MTKIRSVRRRSRSQGKIIRSAAREDIAIDADLVVLSTGILPAEDTLEIGQHYKISLNQDGFFLEAHLKLRPWISPQRAYSSAGLLTLRKEWTRRLSRPRRCVRASTILAKTEISLAATISTPLDANCDGCAYCIDPCRSRPLHSGVHEDGIIKKPSRWTLNLQGCGVCQATARRWEST